MSPANLFATIYSNAPTLEEAQRVESLVHVTRRMDNPILLANHCPVCRYGETGHCDERCETREPNGLPGHFPVPETLACHPAGTCDGCGNEAVELCTWLEDGGAASGVRLSYCRVCMGDDADDPSNEWITGDPIA